eukprot:s6719_g2.t1
MVCSLASISTSRGSIIINITTTISIIITSIVMILLHGVSPSAGSGHPPPLILDIAIIIIITLLLGRAAGNLEAYPHHQASQWRLMQRPRAASSCRASLKCAR